MGPKPKRPAESPRTGTGAEGGAVSDEDDAEPSGPSQEQAGAKRVQSTQGMLDEYSIYICDYTPGIDKKIPQGSVLKYVCTIT